MANQFWARKDSKYTVVSSAPSVNLTQIGNQVVPIPYPVSQKLSKAVATSKDVLVNGKQTYLHGSDTTSVVGDGRGSKGGIKSGTVEAKSQPIVAMASPTVKVNKQRVVRQGDLQYMQGGNTIGKITCSERASLATISDKGAIEGSTLPSDLDEASATALYQRADKPLTRQSMPRKTKPTASGGSGELGAVTGSPVILQTGQLFYTYNHHGLQLAGLMPLDLNLHYLSDKSYKGYFGHNRCFSYEKQWMQIERQRYRLYQVNGREFDFYDSGQGFVDIGRLGVEVQRDGDTFILRYPNQQREIYRHNRLVKIEDAHHNTIQLDYSTDGLLQGIHNNSGARLGFEYSPQGFISTMVDQGGRTWGYDYDQAGHLIRITPPQGMVECYTYQREDNQPARLSIIQDSQDKPKIQVTYDDLGRVNGYQESQARYSYVYHSAQLVEKIDAQGQSTLYGLDDYGIISAISFADGSTQREEYDPKTRTAKVFINHSDPIIKQYDEQQRLISITNGCCTSCGNKVSYQYQGDNPQPTDVFDDGYHIQNTYDQYYQLRSTTIGDETTRYDYDDRGRMVAQIDAAGAKRQFSYNEQDQIATITDPAGYNITLEYDVLHRNISQTNAEGHSDYYQYDALNNIIHHQDALGHQTQFRFNGINQLQTVIDPTGGQTQYQYDQYQRPTSQRNSDDSGKRYHHNSQGQLDAIQREDGSELLFKYDDQGNITQVTARQKTVDSSPEDPHYHEETLHCQYDLDGDLTAADLNGQVTRFDYDGQGRLVGSNQQGIDLSYSYTGKTDLRAGLAFLGESWSYRHDDNQRISHIQKQFDTIIQTHNARGDVVQRDYPNQISDHIHHDDNGQIIAISSTHQQTDIPLSAWHYRRSSRGWITDAQHSPSDTCIHYRYDAIGRLQQAGEQHFEYDSAGNTLAGQRLDGSAYQARYDSGNNRLQQDDAYRYHYDGRGNLTSKQRLDGSQTTIYHYNLFDQLQSVTVHDDQKQLKRRLQFVYDALNRRIGKRTTDFTEQGEQHTTRYYLYDRANIVAILDDNQQLLASIVHGDDIDTPLSITTYNHEPLPLSVIEQTYFDSLAEIDQHTIRHSKTQRTYYYHRDHQGSITALTDQDGKVVESFRYDNSYGQILDHQQSVETHNPYAYTGRELDAPDLYYFRARYYDPRSHRFLSPDPMGLLSGDSNLYRYVENNPVNYRDPAGYKKNCAALDKQKRALYKKAIKPLKKALAKQTVKLGAAAVPFLGWAMAAWTAYDLVTLGIRLDELMDEYRSLEKALEECLSTSKKVKTSKTKEKNKVKGKLRRKCGDSKKHKNQGSDSDEKSKRRDRPNHEKMYSDHIPSKGFVNRYYDDALEGSAPKIKKCVKNAIRDNMETLIIPHDVHKAKTSRTSPRSNAGKAMAKGKRLNEISRAESQVIREEMDKNPKIKGKCKSDITKKLRKFESLDDNYFDNLFEAALAKCMGGNS